MLHLNIENSNNKNSVLGFTDIVNIALVARCSSRVGKKYYEPGRQTISIGSGCNFPSTILHELMHAIGEQE